MKRFALFVTLLAAISPNLFNGNGLAQSKQKPVRSPKQSQKKIRFPAIIEIEDAGGKESRLVAPTEVQVDRDFKITITSFGGGCEEKGDEDVSISDNIAKVKVYDYTIIPSAPRGAKYVGCTTPLKYLEHTVTLRFTKPGKAIIKIHGQKDDINSKREPFVREHRLIVTE